jgi:hypothetical protein
MKNTQLNRQLKHPGFILCVSLLFIYLIIRAVSLSFTHDESLSYTLISGKTLWIDSANNHWLNTLLSYVSSQVFGFSAWALRLPNLLSFLLYAFFVYKLVTAQTSSIFVHISGAVFLLLNHFLIDFFGLFRGYGLAVAFFTGSLYYFLEIINQYNRKQLLFAILFSVLTIYANYAFLHIIVALNLIFVVWSFRSPLARTDFRYVLLFFTIELLLLFPGLLHLLELIQSGQLYFGGEENVIQDTISSVVQYTFPVQQWTFLTEIFIGLILLSILTGFFFYRDKRISPVLMLILFALLIPTALFHFAGVKFPIERSAIYWTVILGVYFQRLSLVLGEIQSSKLAKGLQAGIVLLVCISVFQFIRLANLDHVTIWRYDSETKKMLTLLQREQKAGAICKLGISWVFEPTINYYREVNGYSWLHPVNRDGISTGTYNAYYILDEDFSRIPIPTRLIKTFPDSKTRLLLPLQP